MNKIIISILISCSIFSCIKQEHGCMDCLASNYSGSADIPDNSCQFNLYSEWENSWTAKMALDSGIINIYLNGILIGDSLINDSIYEDIFPHNITFYKYPNEDGNLHYSHDSPYRYTSYGEYTEDNDLINIDFNGVRYLDDRSFFGISVPKTHKKDSLFNVKSGEILTLKRDSLVYRYQIQTNFNDTSSQITNEIDVTRTIFYTRQCSSY